MTDGKSSRPTSRSLMTQPVSRMRSSEVFSVSASWVCSMRTAASLSYGTITPPIIMMRAATADNSFSRPLSFLRQFMASTRKGSSSWRARSASLRVKRRCSGSGASSRCWSSSSSAMRFRFGGIYARPRENRLKVCSTVMLTQTHHGVDARFNFFRASVRFSLASDKNHGARGGDKTGLIDAVAFLFFHDDGGDVGDQILVGGAFAQHGAQVVIVLAEKAGAKLAVGGKTDARAVAAEWLRYRSNEADFAGGTTRSRVQWRSASRGMNTMKRMMTPRSRANCAKDSTSSSLSPRTRTAFTLAGARRDFWAASMPSMTLVNDLVRVMLSNLAGSSESRLMLMRRRPAAIRRSQRSASRWPLVVMERSSTPRAWRRAM